MGIFSKMFKRKESVVDKFRNYKIPIFGIALEIDGLSDSDILWIDNNVRENFKMPDNLPPGMNFEKINEEIYFVIISHCLEQYNNSSKNKEMHMSLIQMYLQAYLDNGIGGIVKSFIPKYLNMWYQYPGRGEVT